MHEEVLGAKCSKKRSRSPRRSHAWAFHLREGLYFLPRHSEPCGCFLFGWFQFSPQKTFGGIFKVIHVLKKKKKKVGRTAGETEKPTQPLFHCSVSRDGRDYGRITLHNMDAPNQIKAETIKARVKATAVSSFIYLPPSPLPTWAGVLPLTQLFPSPISPRLGPTQALFLFFFACTLDRGADWT